MARKFITKLKIPLMGIISFLVLGCNSGSNLNNPPVLSGSHLSSNVKADKGATINVKIQLPAFSIKDIYRERRFISEIKSLVVSLVTNAGDPLGSAIISQPIDITTPAADGVYKLQFSNIPTGTYRAAVQAFDDVNGGGNQIQSANAEGAIVSTNSADVDSELVLSFPLGGQELVVPLNLQEFVPAHEPFDINDNTYPIHNLNLSVNNTGDGLLAWQDADNTVSIMPLKDYIPKAGSLVSETLGGNTNAMSLVANNDGKGLLAYTNTGTGEIAARPITNNTTFGNETIIGSVGGKTMTKPHLNLNSKGDGLVVWSSDQDSTNTSIYGRTITNYVPSGSSDAGFSIFRDDNSVKENPRLSLNEQGDGLIVWQEFDNATSHEIFMNPIENFDVKQLPGTGQINVSVGNQGVSGENTFFTRELEVGSRVIVSETGEELTVQSVDSDTEFTATNNPTNSTTSPSAFTGKAINSTLSGTVTFSVSDSNIVGSGSGFANELKVGNRIKIWNTSNAFSEELIIGTITDDNELSVLTPAITDCSSGCYYTKKGDSMVSSDRGFDSLYPNIKLNSSGDGLIVWKDDGPSIPDNTIRSVQIKNYQSLNNETELAHDYTATTIDGNDITPAGIALNNNGDGIITWSQSNGTVREVEFVQIVDYAPSGAVTPISLDNGSGSAFPVVSLNPGGDGILSLIRLMGASYTLTNVHMKNYLPN
jgi:hypothetical protein